MSGKCEDTWCFFMNSICFLYEILQQKSWISNWSGISPCQKNPRKCEQGLTGNSHCPNLDKTGPTCKGYQRTMLCGKSGRTQRQNTEKFQRPLPVLSPQWCNTYQCKFGLHCTDRLVGKSKDLRIAATVPILHLWNRWTKFYQNVEKQQSSYRLP